MKTRYVVQSWTTEKYTELFRIALNEGDYTCLYAAVAYATIGGVRLLEKTLQSELGAAFDGLQKRWLVGIDWCRSDPPALAYLGGLLNSELRIPGGEEIVETPNCWPTTTYHPKVFVFRGEDSDAVICGSANLSANGLSKGCECGSLTVVTGRAGERHGEPLTTEGLINGFDTAWSRATPYSQIERRYRSQCTLLAGQNRTAPTEDDARPKTAPSRTPISDCQIRQLRTFNNLWIEAGALGANLGRGRPGNQLDMTRFTRVFFGAPYHEVPKNRVIDRLVLVWDGERHANRTLKYGRNGMDKLNVPTPGRRGRMFYENKTLLFERQSSSGEYKFSVGSDAEKTVWRRASEQVQAFYTLPTGREWGLF